MLFQNKTLAFLKTSFFLTCIALAIPDVSFAQYYNMGAFWRPKNLPQPNYGSWSKVEFDPVAVAEAPAVWTGSDMFLWGGSASNMCHDRGYKYNPTSDTWTRVSTSGAPSARCDHTITWTGSVAVVWGGSDYAGTNTNTGARYNPTSNTWAATSTGTNVPLARRIHTAVWTNTEVIIWGGWTTTYTRTGAKYNPSTDTWATVSNDGTTNPLGRYAHSAVWTGTEMIVFGGYVAGTPSKTGGKYNPSTDSWTSTLNDGTTPVARAYPRAIWTGSTMIVWGGYTGTTTTTNTGGVYTPGANTWTATSTGANCPAARTGHAMVWTGTEMIVWGGTLDDSTNYDDGAKYTPGTDTWVAMSMSGAPSVRKWPSYIWTGTQLIVWGGLNSTNILGNGGKYTPGTDTWASTGGATAPFMGTEYAQAVWTGTEMLLYGNDFYSTQGYKYNYATDTWSAMNSTGAPAVRNHTAVWTGTDMIVWGGTNSVGTYLNTGSQYNASGDTWTATSTGAGVPSARTRHTAVWTGTEMIIWGGWSGTTTGMQSGSKFTPGNPGSWSATSTGSNVPTNRYRHAAVWTGTEMIITGGFRYNGSTLQWETAQTGARYTPGANTWATMSSMAQRRYSFPYVWTGSELLVWGGARVSGMTGSETYSYYNSGERYNPTTDTWTNMASTTLSARLNARAVWTGTEMIVWGGQDQDTMAAVYNDGARYKPSNDSWTAMTNTNAPQTRTMHVALAIGNSQMLVWGGCSATSFNRENTVYFYSLLNYCDQLYSSGTCEAVSGCGWTGTICQPDCNEQLTKYGCNMISGCAWSGSVCATSI